MKLVRNIASMITRGFGLDDLDRIMDMVALGVPTASGADISERNAMQFPAVWACVDLISGVGSIAPAKVYAGARGSDDRKVATDHWLYPIVHDMANPTLPASEWRRLTLAHLLTWGNSYSWIERDRKGRATAIWIIPPSSVKVERGSTTGLIRYFILNRKANVYDEFPAKDILHIRGLGYDGTVGYSPVGMLRETYGLASANQQTSAAMHKSGLTSRLVLEYPGTLKEEQVKELRESFEKAYGGLGNSKAIILQNEMKAKPISIHPQDAQFLEQCKYTDAKIYQIYGCPPHMVGDTEKSTSWGTGIEQQTIGFLTFRMLPWLNLIETWIGEKMLTGGEKTHYVEHEMKGLLRADTAGRATWYQTQVELGVYSPNDVLRKENEPTYLGGNVYRRPLNTGFVDADGNVVAITPPGAGKEVQDEK